MEINKGKVSVSPGISAQELLWARMGLRNVGKQGKLERSCCRSGAGRARRRLSAELQRCGARCLLTAASCRRSRGRRECGMSGMIHPAGWNPALDARRSAAGRVFQAPDPAACEVWEKLGPNRAGERRGEEPRRRRWSSTGNWAFPRETTSGTGIGTGIGAGTGRSCAPVRCGVGASPYLGARPHPPGYRRGREASIGSSRGWRC